MPGYRDRGGSAVRQARRTLNRVRRRRGRVRLRPRPPRRRRARLLLRRPARDAPRSTAPGRGTPPRAGFDDRLHRLRPATAGTRRLPATRPAVRHCELRRSRSHRPASTRRRTQPGQAHADAPLQICRLDRLDAWQRVLDQVRFTNDYNRLYAAGALRPAAADNASGLGALDFSRSSSTVWSGTHWSFKAMRLSPGLLLAGVAPAATRHLLHERRRPDPTPPRDLSQLAPSRSPSAARIGQGHDDAGPMKGAGVGCWLSQMVSAASWVRSLVRALVSRRETCIWEMPIWSAIWDWVRLP
jgi:hypothetical protein